MTSTRRFFPSRSVLTSGLGVILSGALAATLLVSAVDRARPPVSDDRATLTAASNPVTPGNFTGFAFDQCQAPKQSSMNTWLNRSPYLAVGIYISGNSRGCRNQTYLNATWVHTQLAKGWHLLPLTLGPQASCQPRFPRYGDDPKINPASADLYQKARVMGRTEATRTVTNAKALGLVRGSVMYYDLEGFTYSNTACRESAMWFVSAWTKQIHALGYKAGLYSSAGSGMKAIDYKRAHLPAGFVLPDQIWFADWNGSAALTSSYISNAGWTSHQRLHQYEGGHNETWGGVTIDVDRSYIDVGHGSVAPTKRHCGGIRVDFPRYPAIEPPKGRTRPDAAHVRALKCLLKERGSYRNAHISGRYGPTLRTAIEAWERLHHIPVNPIFGRRDWMSLFAHSAHPLIKRGIAGEPVRNLERALNAVTPNAVDPINGVFDFNAQQALIAYQKKIGGAGAGIGNSATWAALAAGKFTK